MSLPFSESGPPRGVIVLSYVSASSTFRVLVAVRRDIFLVPNAVAGAAVRLAPFNPTAAPEASLLDGLALAHSRLDAVSGFPCDRSRHRQSLVVTTWFVSRFHNRGREASRDSGRRVPCEHEP